MDSSSQSLDTVLTGYIYIYIYIYMYIYIYIYIYIYKGDGADSMGGAHFSLILVCVLFVKRGSPRKTVV